MSRQRLLWSGGFDSTYLLLTAIAAGCAVEPVYLHQGLDWQKQRREVEARHRILAGLPAELRSHVVIPGRDVEGRPEALPDETWKAFWVLRKELPKVSLQNTMLCQVARESGPVVAGIVREDQTARSRRDLRALRKCGVSMPLLRVGKREMLADAERRGFAHLLALTWSSEGTNEAAVAGACGKCLPCSMRILPAPARP